MFYTVKEDDVSMGASALNTVIEVSTVALVIVLCALLSRAGYREYGVLIAIATLTYYILVAYVKLMFSRLKVGETYKFEPTTFGINLTVDKHNIVWIPVLVFTGKEEQLRIYSLSLVVKDNKTEEREDEH